MSDLSKSLPPHTTDWRMCPICFGSGESGEPMDLIDGTGCWRCGGKGEVEEIHWDDEEED